MYPQAIPQGTQPGQDFNVLLSSGGEIKVTLPDDYTSGDSFNYTHHTHPFDSDPELELRDEDDIFNQIGIFISKFPWLEQYVYFQLYRIFLIQMQSRFARLPAIGMITAVRTHFENFTLNDWIEKCKNVQSEVFGGNEIEDLVSKVANSFDTALQASVKETFKNTLSKTYSSAACRGSLEEPHNHIHRGVSQTFPEDTNELYGHYDTLTKIFPLKLFMLYTIFMIILIDLFFAFSGGVARMREIECIEYNIPTSKPTETTWWHASNSKDGTVYDGRPSEEFHMLYRITETISTYSYVYNLTANPSFSIPEQKKHIVNLLLTELNNPKNHKNFEYDVFKADAYALGMMLKRLDFNARNEPMLIQTLTQAEAQRSEVQDIDLVNFPEVTKTADLTFAKEFQGLLKQFDVCEAQCQDCLQKFRNAINTLSKNKQSVQTTSLLQRQNAFNSFFSPCTKEGLQFVDKIEPNHSPIFICHPTKNGGEWMITFKAKTQGRSGLVELFCLNMQTNTSGKFEPVV